MPERIEWIVALSPVRDADRRRHAGDDPDQRIAPRQKAALESHRGERIAELHRQVRDGVYDTMATLDTVARRILQSGDL